MRMLARPTSPIRFRFALEVDGTERGTVEHRLWGRPGRISADGWTGQIRRTGMQRYDLIGAVDEPPRGRAEPLGMLRQSYVLTWPGGSMEVHRRGLGYGMRLVSDGIEVGRLGLRSLLTRTLVADVPDSTPIEIVGLLVYLVVRLRRRAIPSSGGA